MLSQLVYEKITTEMRKAKHILLVSDKRADGDSLGSVTALSFGLRQLGIENTVFVAEEIPGSLQFLVTNIRCVIGRNHLDLSLYDLLVTCDIGSIDLTGIADLIEQERVRRRVTLINIDHHSSNTRFGNINALACTSANTEIVYGILERVGCRIDKNMATSLLTGLLTDTGNFSNAATTYSALKIASRLMLKGARMDRITSKTWKNKSVSMLQLWGKVLLRLRADLESSITITLVTKQDLIDANLGPDAVEGVANFLNSLAHTNAVLVLREEDGYIKGSLRTTKEGVDVSKIAKIFGGGGHEKAAGFTVPGKIVELE